MKALLILGLMLACNLPAWGIWGYSTPITFGKATNTDQANFPVPVFLNDARFKTVANGGHVQNTVTQVGGNPVVMPADFAIGSDSLCASQLPFEFESYDATTGIGVLHAKVASLTTATNASGFACYGDVAKVTQQNTGSYSVANVWVGFAGVWHLPTIGGVISAKDSTSNANDGTLVNAPTATAGKIDGAAAFVAASSQCINVGTGSSLNLSGAFAIDAWASYTRSGVDASLWDQNTATHGMLINWSNGGLRIYVNTGANTYTVTGLLSLNTTYHVAIAHDGVTNLAMYYGGALVGSSAAITPLAGLAGTTNRIGCQQGIQNYWGGFLDGVKLHNVYRTADWFASTVAAGGTAFNTIAAENVATSGVKHRVAGTTGGQ